MRTLMKLRRPARTDASTQEEFRPAARATAQWWASFVTPAGRPYDPRHSTEPSKQVGDFIATLENIITERLSRHGECVIEVKNAATAVLVEAAKRAGLDVDETTFGTWCSTSTTPSSATRTYRGVGRRLYPAN